MTFPQKLIPSLIERQTSIEYSMKIETVEEAEGLVLELIGAAFEFKGLVQNAQPPKSIAELRGPLIRPAQAVLQKMIEEHLELPGMESAKTIQTVPPNFSPEKDLPPGLKSSPPREVANSLSLPGKVLDDEEEEVGIGKGLNSDPGPGG